MCFASLVSISFFSTVNNFSATGGVFRERGEGDDLIKNLGEAHI